MIDSDTRIISERELGEHLEEIIAELRERNTTALISRHGKLVARLVPVEDDGPPLSEAFTKLANRLPAPAEIAAETTYPVEQLTAPHAAPVERA